MIKNPLISLTAILFAFLSSCGNDAPTAVASTGKGGFSFGYLRYDSATVEYRLDSLHNRGLILQFCLKEAGDNNTPFQLISYAYDTLNDYNNSWIPDTLGLITDSVPRNFAGRMIIGNNEITRAQLLNAVRDDAGNRFSYDYLLFTPVLEGVFNHVVYRIRPVKGQTPAPGSRTQMTSPMPPSRVW